MAGVAVPAPISALIQSTLDHQGSDSPFGRPVRETDLTLNPFANSCLHRRWPRKPLPPKTTHVGALDMWRQRKYFFFSRKKSRFYCTDFSRPIRTLRIREPGLDLSQPEFVFLKKFDNRLRERSRIWLC